MSDGHPTGVWVLACSKWQCVKLTVSSHWSFWHEEMMLFSFTRHPRCIHTHLCLNSLQMLPPSNMQLLCIFQTRSGCTLGFTPCQQWATNPADFARKAIDYSKSSHQHWRWPSEIWLFSCCLQKRPIPPSSRQSVAMNVSVALFWMKCFFLAFFHLQMVN